MEVLSSNIIIISLCLIVILSYVFIHFSAKIKVPSVLLLIFTGLLLRVLFQNIGIKYEFPSVIIEILGTIGLIFIILEAGLDLKVEKSKSKLILKSFFTAFVVMFFSVLFISMIINFWYKVPIINRIVYALPLSIISGAIVIPSIYNLSPLKKEFLTYEASFSDILGILFFNYIIVKQVIDIIGISFFVINIFISIILSFFITIILLKIIVFSEAKVKFFLLFSILILLYVLGKMINLPSLLIILIFAIIISNKEKIKIRWFENMFSNDRFDNTIGLLSSFTNESSFLVRTFFFLFFGYSIDIYSLMNKDVLILGSIVVMTLLIIRGFFMKFALGNNIFPEIFYMPRGLITILLFYKIPNELKLNEFNDAVVYFVIIATSLIMFVGSLLYKTPLEEAENINQKY